MSRNHTDEQGAPKQLIKGRRYETPELIDAGLLPPEFGEKSEGVPVVSTVTEVDRERGVVTFDTTPAKE